MWRSAREKFYASIPKECGLPDEKHELIKKLLETWDDKSAAERREMSGGNHIFWRDKYRVIDGHLCYAAGDAAGEDEDALNIKQVSCVSTMYDDIKSVHVASACHSSLTLSHPVSPSRLVSRAQRITTRTRRCSRLCRPSMGTASLARRARRHSCHC